MKLYPTPRQILLILVIAGIAIAPCSQIRAEDQPVPSTEQPAADAKPKAKDTKKKVKKKKTKKKPTSVPAKSPVEKPSDEM